MYRVKVIASTVVAALAVSILLAAAPTQIKAKPKPIVTENVPQYLDDTSVTIRAASSEGSGALNTTKDGQVWVWTCGHVVAGLRRERTTTDKKVVVDFDDAKIVKVLTEEGRKVGEMIFDAEVIRYSDSEFGQDLALLRVRTKKYKPVGSTVFYLEDKIPAIGTKLLHCGSLLGTVGSSSVTNGIVSQQGRVLFGVVFDQTNCATFRGSSGGIVCLENDGRYVGMLVRGAGETFSLYVPVRRMRAWAKNVGVEFALDPDLPVPTDAELKKKPVDEDVAIKDMSARAARERKAFPTREQRLFDLLGY